MFEMLRSQSRSATGAILYVTVGTLLMIWSCLTYYYFLMNNPSAPAWQNFLCIGTILSGFAIATIGLLFGIIGRGAKAADTTVATVAAAPIAPVVAAPGVVGGQVVTAAPMAPAGYANPSR